MTMGLDVTAYRKLRKIETQMFDADGRPDHGTRLRINPHFPDRAEGIEDGAVYDYEDSIDFRAGSYGGYNAWREQLAKLVGYPLTEHRDHGGAIVMRHAASCWNGATGPFSELINFADNDGVIGPVVSKKLAADFARFEQQAKATATWFAESYGLWKRAFEMAADGGAVEFH
jgi:hypothetical protein